MLCRRYRRKGRARLSALDAGTASYSQRYPRCTAFPNAWPSGLWALILRVLFTTPSLPPCLGYSGRTPMIMHTRRPLIHLSRSVGAYYEPHVRPWVHYVPATEENLTAAAEWLHTHPQRARAVADAAYQAPTPLNAVSTAATNATPFCCHHYAQPDSLSAHRHQRGVSAHTLRPQFAPCPIGGDDALHPRSGGAPSSPSVG